MGVKGIGVAQEPSAEALEGPLQHPQEESAVRGTEVAGVVAGIVVGVGGEESGTPASARDREKARPGGGIVSVEHAPTPGVSSLPPGASKMVLAAGAR